MARWVDVFLVEPDESIPGTHIAEGEVRVALGFHMCTVAHEHTWIHTHSKYM